jgi:hypothetical protein
MALEKMAGRGSWGIAFLVAAGIVAEIVAKACSSPQTTELNADTRAPTLMKWVNVGMIEAALFVAAAAYFDPVHRVPIIMGGASEGAITYLQYLHAKQAGLASSKPGTETTSSAPKATARAQWGAAT